MAIPQPRYKIIERGRRLVTIDTLTGLEIGASAERPSPAEAKDDQPAQPQSALGPIIKANRPAADTPSSDMAGRIAILAVAGIAGLAFLFLSGAWIVVAIALAVPPVRAAAFSAAKAATARFLNPDG